MSRMRWVFMAGVVALVAGCGGGGGVSKADYIKRGDAICANEHVQARAIPRPTFNPARATRNDMPAAARYLDRYAPVFGGGVAQLDKLSRPSQDRQLLDRTLSQANQIAAAYNSARDAADKGDPQSFKLALAKAASVGPSARAGAAQFGFKVCGR